MNLFHNKSPGFVDFVPREQSVSNLIYSLTLGINQWITIGQFVLALTATWTYRILSNLGFHILHMTFAIEYFPLESSIPSV